MNDVLLTDMIPADILQEIQDAFSEYTGMAALITDAKGAPVTKGSGFTGFCMEMTRKSAEGARKCEACDRQGAFLTMQSGKPTVYSCHAGLTDYAAPILLNGAFIGSFIGGQVRTAPVDEETIRKKAEEYHIDPDEYVKAAKATNEIKKEEIDKAAYFLQKLAGILSKIAFQTHQALSQSHEMEENAKKQTDFLMVYSNELKQNIGELYSFFSSNDKNDSAGAQFQKKVNGLMARTLELGSLAEDRADYNNIMSGDFKLYETIYNIRSVVEMKILEYAELTAKAGNTIEFNIGSDVPEKLVGDPARIGSMIGKLIETGNGRTSGAHIRLLVDSKKSSYATELEISVSNDLDRIEENRTEYIRRYLLSRGVSDLHDEEIDMSGFSLIGYHINAMSGGISLTSDQEKGVEFKVTIPQLEAKGGDI